MKKIALVLALLLMLSCAFVGCGKKGINEADSSTPLADVWDVPYQYDLSKYIDISEDDYIGLSYKDISYEVTDDDIQYEIQKLLDEHAVYTDVTDRSAQNGDFVNIDYTGFIDGEAFENGAEEGAEFVLGEASFIPGFQEGIVGHNVGETFTVDVTFPNDYGVETLNGKAAQFEMTINKLQSVSYPAIDNDFVSANTEYKTVEEYYKALNDKLSEQASSSIKVQLKNSLFEDILKNVEVLEYPKVEYDRYYNEVISQYFALAQQYGQDLSTFITQTAGTSLEEFYAYADEYAKSSVKSEIAFFAIANEIGLIDNLTKENYDVYLENVANEYKSTPEEFVAMYGYESVLRSLVWDSVMDYVLENGVAVESETDKTDSDDKENGTTDAAEVAENTESVDDASANNTEKSDDEVNPGDTSDNNTDTADSVDAE